MKILIIADIHNKIGIADDIIQQEGDADKCIFLGDYWDAIGDTPNDARRVAEWVRSRIFDPRFVFLWGNHDVAYAFPNKNILCKGFTESKRKAIREVLNHEHFDQFKFFWMTQGFLLTHAGLHPNYMPPHWKTADITTANLKSYLSRESEKCLIELCMDNGKHWFFEVGDARCVPPRGIEAGGLLWCDAREEFVSVPKVSQVFGHTTFKEYPTVIFGDEHNNNRASGRIASLLEIHSAEHWNVALDTALKCYAVINDGVLTIKKFIYF